jgi:uncharacterized Tic20 family protein
MKIIDDTLKKNGKWDKQALTFFVSFVISCLLGFVIVLLSYGLGVKDNGNAMEVFQAFMLLVIGLSGANIANKVVDKKYNDK